MGDELFERAHGENMYFGIEQRKHDILLEEDDE